MNWEDFLVNSKERREKQSIYLLVNVDEKRVIRILDSKDDTKGYHDHWVEKSRQFVACRSQEGVCPLCEADDVRVRRTHPVLLMNVYVYDEKRVRILQLRGGDYFAFVSVAEEDEDINLRDYTLKGEPPTGNAKRAKLRLYPIDKEKSRVKEIPDDIQKEKLTDYFIIPDEDYSKKALKGIK